MQSSLKQHGRRGEQCGADARRPGAAAQGTRAAAAAAVAASCSAACGSEPSFRDVHEARQAEQDEEERAQRQEASHLMMISKVSTPAQAVCRFGVWYGCSRLQIGRASCRERVSR